MSDDKKEIWLMNPIDYKSVLSGVTDRLFPSTINAAGIQIAECVAVPPGEVWMVSKNGLLRFKNVNGASHD